MCLTLCADADLLQNFNWKTHLAAGVNCFIYTSGIYFLYHSFFTFYHPHNSLDCVFEHTSQGVLLMYLIMRSASTATLIVPPRCHSTIGDAHFRPRLRAYGTACHSASPHRRRWQFAGGASKQNSSSDVLARTVPDDSSVVILYMLDSKHVLSVVKCSCSPRILWHFNHTCL